MYTGCPSTIVLYPSCGSFFAALVKRADPSIEVIVYERNRPDDTFGFGVVFSDATLATLAAADDILALQPIA
jgi:anthraniloyl-CoA monooxygenase